MEGLLWITLNVSFERDWFYETVDVLSRIRETKRKRLTAVGINR